MDESLQMQMQADKIRSANVLGRSGVLPRLFEFLLQQSLSGHKPKELEIAIGVFGKSVDFEASLDSGVRVYIHKLRRRLDEYYAGPGAQEPARLVLPKGGYRLVIEVPAPKSSLQSTLERAIALSTKLGWRTSLHVMLLAAATVLFVTLYISPPRNASPLDSLREHPVWSSLLADDRPIFIVVGDYYIFGETDLSMEVRRLVREFDINSGGDLQRRMDERPELMDQYVNLDLSYLPIATAFALRDVLPVLAETHKQLEVVLSSNVNAYMLKSAHIIYIGYVSGMGKLQDLAFSKSRFAVGQSFDELVDRETGRDYVSQGGRAVNGKILYHDYGYLSSFIGPNGNRLLIVAGTRDVAVMHMAEVLTSSQKLEELSAITPALPGFEALYEVSGIDRMNVSGRLLLTSPRDANVAARHRTELSAHTPTPAPP